MKKINNKGFTLVELIATLVLLVLVMGIGAYSITAVIQNSKEKNYQLLVKEIKNATELYYQECKYTSSSGVICPTVTTDDGHDWYEVKLDDLIKYGFLNANFNGENDSSYLVNPKDDKYIGNCVLRYSYYDGQFWYKTNDEIGSSCPSLQE